MAVDVDISCAEPTTGSAAAANGDGGNGGSTAGAEDVTMTGFGPGSLRTLAGISGLGARRATSSSTCGFFRPRRLQDLCVVVGRQMRSQQSHRREIDGALPEQVESDGEAARDTSDLDTAVGLAFGQ
jgi:hypothetical protein